MSEQTSSVLELEDDILAFTHSKRRIIIDDLLKAGVPQDPDNVKVILSALKDMDGQALGRKRIKVDEKANSNHEQAAALIAKVLAASHGNHLSIIEGHSHREIPMLPDHIPAPVLVDDETAINIVNQSYDNFISEFVDEELK